MDMATALQEIQNWSPDDQIELVQKVWDNVVDLGWQPELTEEQRAELDRRIEALESNPNDVVTWDTIVNHVRRKR
jgi:putative addiction module component (TIGR02574 family)